MRSPLSSRTSDVNIRSAPRMREYEPIADRLGRILDRGRRLATDAGLVTHAPAA